MLETNFSTTPEDHFEFHLYQRKRLGLDKALLYPTWFMAVVSCLLLASLFLSTLAISIPLCVLAGILGLTWPTIFHQWDRRSVRSMMKHIDPEVLSANYSLQLGEEGLNWKTNKSQSSVQWNNIKEAVVHGDSTYLYLTLNHVLLLPKRGFEQEKDYEAVQQFAISKIGPRPSQAEAP